MSQHLASLVERLLVIGTAFCVRGSDWVDVLMQNAEYPLEPALVAGLSLAAVAWRTVAWATRRVFGHSRRLRARLWGRDFVEGHWFDVVVVPGTNVIREYGLVEMVYRRGEVKPVGILFNVRGERIGSFAAHAAVRREHVLEYSYFRAADHGQVEEASGVGKYVFPRECPWPMTYVGTFFDSRRETMVPVRGFRVEHPEDLRRIQSRSLEDQKAVVLGFAEMFARRFPEYEARADCSPGQ